MSSAIAYTLSILFILFILGGVFLQLVLADRIQQAAYDWINGSMISMGNMSFLRFASQVSIFFLVWLLRLKVYFLFISRGL
jgi:hypothetical protein